MTNRNRAIRAPRMQRTWATVDASTFTVAIANTPVAVDLLTNIKTNLDLVPHGVTSSAIRLTLGFDVIGDENEKVDLSYGVCWLYDGAVASTVPDPAEESFDWIAFGSSMLEIPEGQAVGKRKFYEVKLESNAMRKQGNARRSLILVAGIAFTTATSVTVHTSGRVLLLGL